MFKERFMTLFQHVTAFIIMIILAVLFVLLVVVLPFSLWFHFDPHMEYLMKFSYFLLFVMIAVVCYYAVFYGYRFLMWLLIEPYREWRRKKNES